MLLLTLRDLQYRGRRVAVVTLLVALVATLLFLMTGLVHQLRNEPHDTVDVIGVDMWLVSEGVSGPFTAQSVLPSGVVPVFDSEGAAAVVVARATLTADDEEQEIVLFGHGAGELGEPEVATGRAVAEPGEVVADRSAGVEIGDALEIGGEDVVVVGLTEKTTVLAGLPLVFMELGQAQQVAFGSTDAISAVVTNSPVQGWVRGARPLTGTDVADDALGPIDSAISSIDLIRALLWAVAAIVIGSVVYLSALERNRDFAVLKAVGAGNRALGAGLAVQAVLIALLGVGIAAGLQALVQPFFPLAVTVPTTAFWQLPAVAVLVAVAAGVAGMRRVARTDPAAAFGGPVA